MSYDILNRHRFSKVIHQDMLYHIFPDENSDP